VDPIERVRRQSVVNRRWHLQVNVAAASFLLPDRVRNRLLRRSGLDLGAGADIRPRCFFFSSDVHIGENSGAAVGCYFDTRAPIHLGRSVRIGPQTMLLTAGHDYGGPEMRCGPFVAEPIWVGDGTWIGARCLVLPGTTIAEGCIITAGSLVYGELQPHGLYAGTPARRVRDLEV
jgi:acetyltransferase-like isoleucine patch superfamily enzyme